MKTKVVQFCAFRSYYNDNLQKKLLESQKFCNIHTNVPLYFDELVKEFDCSAKTKNKIGRYIKFCFFLCRNYKFDRQNDVICIQFIQPIYVLLLPYFLLNFKKIIVMFWGSDLLRAGKKKLFLYRFILNKVDIIGLETPVMKTKFNEVYGKKYNNKIEFLRFGLDLLDKLDELKEIDVKKFANLYKIDLNRKVITIGYSSIEEHQHIIAIQSLIDNKIDSKEVFLLIPWTYGSRDINYKKKIELLLENRFDYAFIENKLTDCEMAALRKISEIMIHIETTDSLSASMLETLYAENSVITGSWLPYEDLIIKGINMCYIDTPEKCGVIVKQLLHNPQCKKELKFNKKIVYELSSWSHNIDRWIDIF